MINNAIILLVSIFGLDIRLISFEDLFPILMVSVTSLHMPESVTLAMIISMTMLSIKMISIISFMNSCLVYLFLESLHQRILLFVLVVIAKCFVPVSEIMVLTMMIPMHSSLMYLLLKRLHQAISQVID